MRLFLRWSLVAILSIAVGCSSDVGSSEEQPTAQQLQAQDVHTRLQAFETIRDTGDQVVGRLNVAIRSEDAAVRKAAVEAAASIGNGLLNAVRATLNDSERTVREASESALQSLVLHEIDPADTVAGDAIRAESDQPSLRSWLRAYFGQVHSVGSVAGLVVAIIVICVATVNIAKLRYAHRERLALIAKGLYPESEAHAPSVSRTETLTDKNQ